MKSSSNQPIQDPSLDQAILRNIIPNTIKSVDSILPQLKKLSTYLGFLKPFQSQEDQETIRNHFITIASHEYFSIDRLEVNELSATIICAFVDIMQIFAPVIIFDMNIIKFYLSYILKFLQKVEILNLNYVVEVKLTYIVARLAKSNLLSIVVGTEWETQIPCLISQIYTYQEQKQYEEKTDMFNNLCCIIIGLLEEINETPIDLTLWILVNLNKKKYPESYKISKFILTKLKNFWATPINELVISKDKIQLQNKDYLTLIKEWSKISMEFILNIFLYGPKKDWDNKINKCTYISIYLKVFSCEHSLPYVLQYTEVWYWITKRLNNTNTELDIKIFKAIVKFWTRNSKEQLIKENKNIYTVLLEKLESYLKNIRSVNTVDKWYSICLKQKNIRIIRLWSTNLTLYGNKTISTESIKLTMKYLNNTVFSTTSIYAINSIEMLRQLKKIADMFNIAIEKVDAEESFNEIIMWIIDDLFTNHSKNVPKSWLLSIMFYFSLNNKQIDHRKKDFNLLVLNQFSKDLNTEDKPNPILQNIFNEDLEYSAWIDFCVGYLDNVDEDSNNFTVKMWNAMLYSIMYYMKYVVFTNKINDSIIKEIIGNTLKLLDKMLSLRFQNEDLVTSIWLIVKHVMHYNNSDDIKDSVRVWVLDKIASYFFNNNNIIVHNFANVFISYNSWFPDQEILLPENFNTFIMNPKLSNPVIFINDVIKSDKDNKYVNVFYSADIKEYITVTHKQWILKEIEEKNEELKHESNDKIIKMKIVSNYKIYHEIWKYQFHYLIKVVKYIEDKAVFLNEVDNFLKFIWNNIYVYFEKDYKETMKNIKTVKKENKSKSKENTLKEHTDNVVLYYKVHTQIQLLSICKYINLWLKFCENDIAIKWNFQIKLSNLFLCKDTMIRRHFVNKIYKRMTSGAKSWTNYLNIIPMVFLLIPDEDKSLSKLATTILTMFFKTWQSKLKTRNIEDNSTYKYIPEVYWNYVLVYFIFNSNLNILFKTSEKKSFFNSILNTFFQLIKKVTNNNLDSDFILRCLAKLKDENLKNKKKIKKIFKTGLVLDVSYDTDEVNYESVKNGWIEHVMRLVNSKYSNDFSYGNWKPKLPVIFLNEDRGNNSGNAKPFVLDTTKIMVTASAMKDSKSDFKVNGKISFMDKSINISSFKNFNEDVNLRESVDMSMNN